MKKLLPILIAIVSVVFVLLAIVSNQQLVNYAREFDVVAKINAAGADELPATCQTFHLPVFARLFDIVTPGAFLSLVTLAGVLVMRKKFDLTTSMVRVLLGILIIGLTVMIIYQFIDPFYPFTLCRGLLP